jgi:SAM-dependent methyltransferase
VPTLTTLLKRGARRLLPRRAKSPAPVSSAADDPTFRERKRRKLDRIRPLLRDDMACEPGRLFYDFLTPELRDEFNITDTANVSAHDYDGHALGMIRDLAGGMILDCGAGLRRVYYDDVVNFEICDYATTDVRGVAEVLPFRSGVFDAAFSFGVLEHLRDPFACARELARVLKPGGRLYCVVPFLQPYHGYPHHYYNMTAQGLSNLFSDTLHIDKQEVNTGGQPIFMLTWVLRRWAAGLPAGARKQFLGRGWANCSATRWTTSGGRSSRSCRRSLGSSWRRRHRCWRTSRRKGDSGVGAASRAAPDGPLRGPRSASARRTYPIRPVT